MHPVTHPAIRTVLLIATSLTNATDTSNQNSTSFNHTTITVHKDITIQPSYNPPNDINKTSKSFIFISFAVTAIVLIIIGIPLTIHFYIKHRPTSCFTRKYLKLKYRIIDFIRTITSRARLIPNQTNTVS